MHVVASATALVAQSWRHVRVAGVNAPFVHTIAVAAEMKEPTPRVGVQVAPRRMVPLLQVVASATALVVQSWWHMKAAGVNVPPMHTNAVAAEEE